MNLINRMLFENSANAENLEAIMKIAKEVLDYQLSENDYLTDASIDSQGRLYFDFSQEALDIEDGATLWADASDLFHENFNLRARTELFFE